MNNKPMFIDLVEKHQKDVGRVIDEKKGNKPIRKVQVKALKGSPYVISLEETDIVGEGSFGKVVRAYDIENKNEDLVAKIIPLNDKSKYESMQMELNVLVKLPQHINLVNYKKIQLSSKNCQYFIIDYCNGGTLTAYMKKKTMLSESEIVEFIQQFSKGYRVLYRQGIIHRDIKPDNILMHNRVFKIADFGLAKIVDSYQIQNISTRGTPLYIAPELVKKEKASSKVDMWSLGVILYRMLFKGRYPFLDPTVKYNVTTALEHIQEKTLVIPSTPKRSNLLIDLVKQMLEKEEGVRISWEELFAHDLIAFSLSQEDEEDNQEGFNSGSSINMCKKLQRSSIYVNKMEVMRQSMIKMTPLLDCTRNKTNEIQDKQIKQKESGSGQEIEEGEEEEREGGSLQKINMKKMLAIIKENKRRLKTNIGINRVEEILLNYREKVLFIDKICLRMIIMSKLIGRIGLIEFENYSTLSQKGVILLLQMALIYNNQLINFNPNSNNAVKQVDWQDYLMSENVLILNGLFKQDKYCLQEFMKEYTNEKDNTVLNKLEYSTFVKTLNMTDFFQEIQDVFQPFFKMSVDVYDKVDDLQKGLVIFLTYLYQAYMLNNENCVLHTFESFYDYWTYYENVEENSTNTLLFESYLAHINLM